MQLEIVELGRMDGNMVRLLRAGDDCVVFEGSPAAVAAMAAEGVVATSSLEANRLMEHGHTRHNPTQNWGWV
jgi:6-phosphogluconate dehydrogenase